MEFLLELLKPEVNNIPKIASNSSSPKAGQLYSMK